MHNEAAYEDFIEKFKPKKTTDDCYTPPNIYDAVRDWAIERYDLQKKKIIRPFYPGKDYQKEDYPPGCVVIDNPPFSILSKICAWYEEHEIDYFLFAPTLSLFSTNSGKSKYIVSGGTVTYENGAKVNTSFVTNLDKNKIVVSHELHDIIAKADKKNKATTPFKKYDYPLEVCTAAKLGYLSKHGVSMEISEKDCFFIRALDSQKETKRGIFGGGFLVSEKAAAEKAAAERWYLSDKEKKIIISLK